MPAAASTSPHALRIDESLKPWNGANGDRAFSSTRIWTASAESGNLCSFFCFTACAGFDQTASVKSKSPHRACNNSDFLAPVSNSSWKNLPAGSSRSRRALPRRSSSPLFGYRVRLPSATRAARPIASLTGLLWIVGHSSLLIAQLYAALNAFAHLLAVLPCPVATMLL
jgi:hypothetical protein